jgi:hypothetical protein
MAGLRFGAEGALFGYVFAGAKMLKAGFTAPVFKDDLAGLWGLANLTNLAFAAAGGGGFYFFAGCPFFTFL